jgi:hypothetical protein
VSVSIHLRVPSRQYDAVYAQAQHARLSVPELIRRRVARGDEDEDESDND